MSWPADPGISDLLLFAARRIPNNTRAADVMASAFSMATSMLEGCLDDDPMLAALAVLMYRKRLRELEREMDEEISEAAARADQTAANDEYL